MILAVINNNKDFLVTQVVFGRCFLFRSRFSRFSRLNPRSYSLDFAAVLADLAV